MNIVLRYFYGKDRADIQPPVHEAETQGFEALLASTESGSTGIGEDVVVEK